MDYQASIALGATKGLSRQKIEMLRSILGYADTSKYHYLTPAQREQLVRDYTEGEISMSALAKKYSVHYNAVRSLLVTRDVIINDPHRWTKRQEMYLSSQLARRIPINQIADAIGKSVKAVRDKARRMKLIPV